MAESVPVMVMLVRVSLSFCVRSDASDPGLLTLTVLAQAPLASRLRQRRKKIDFFMKQHIRVKIYDGAN
jgi:hypothetical protein